MSGVRVSHADFGPAGDGVHNVTPLSCGTAGAGWEVHAVGLYVDDAGSSPLLTAHFDPPIEPAEGDPMTFDVGGLVFTISGSA